MPDEAAQPLAAGQEAEPARIRRNFYGVGPSYHVAGNGFIHKLPRCRPP